MIEKKGDSSNKKQIDNNSSSRDRAQTSLTPLNSSPTPEMYAKFSVMLRSAEVKAKAKTEAITRKSKENSNNNIETFTKVVKVKAHSSSEITTHVSEVMTSTNIDISSQTAEKNTPVKSRRSTPTFIITPEIYDQFHTGLNNVEKEARKKTKEIEQNWSPEMKALYGVGSQGEGSKASKVIAERQNLSKNNEKE